MAGDDQPAAPRVCDFCGEPAERVRRVALDGDYDRLRKPHQERYACPTCSEAKERQRRAADPARVDG